jgi:hypothetical protein
MSQADSKLSGAAWWHANQAKFPNSRSIADLAPPFREKVQAFVDALKAAGASIDVASTLRNKKRAYLMHFSWKVAKDLVAANLVPGEGRCRNPVGPWRPGEIQGRSSRNGRLVRYQGPTVFGVASHFGPGNRHGYRLARNDLNQDGNWRDCNGRPSRRRSDE